MHARQVLYHWALALDQQHKSYFNYSLHVDKQWVSHCVVARSLKNQMYIMDTYGPGLYTSPSENR
jgi:hypothetical protein